MMWGEIAVAAVLFFMVRDALRWVARRHLRKQQQQQQAMTPYDAPHAPTPVQGHRRSAQQPANDAWQNPPGVTGITDMEITIHARHYDFH